MLNGKKINDMNIGCPHVMCHIITEIQKNIRERDQKFDFQKKVTKTLSFLK